MMKTFVGVGIAAAAVIAMATGCSDDGAKSGTLVPAGNGLSSVAIAPATAAAKPGVAKADDANTQPQSNVAAPAPEAAPAPALDPSPGSNPAPVDSPPPAAVPVDSPAEPPPHEGPIGGTRSDSPTSGHGYCLDINSGGVGNAFSTLSGGFGSWAPYAGTDAKIGACPSLMYMTAETAGGTGSSPTHVLFFTGDGKYLGTANPKGTAWTSVVGATDTSVSVQYKWLTGDEPLCCPQGGPLTVTYTLDGSGVTPDQALPPEVHAS